MASTEFKPVFNPKLTIERSAAPIKIDGILDDAGWQSAGQTRNFVERSPGDMTEPEVRTDAFITYDEDNLYVGFFCYDDPATIRATMCQRDEFGGDDAVVLLVDPYGDATWAYEFFVNPYGIQKDRMWTSIGGEDAGYDLIWESAAQITDSGYQVEIAVPFSSMRFPGGDVQTWKVDLWRNRPRESFNQYSWAAYDRNEQCWVCQWGTVEGIANVQPGKGLEILPTLVANQSGRISETGEGFDNSKVDGEASLAAKYSVSSDVTVEAAYNPDFSQIEADAGQIDVNSTISLMYPERRPFFQEGSDIFRTLFMSFYTRSVNDPQFTAKLTGRGDRSNIGFLTAVDENTPYMIPMPLRSIVLNSGRSVVNVLRGNRSLGTSSQLGFMVTDRRFENDGSGTIMALDGNIRLSQNYRVDGQFVFSHTQEPDDSAMTAGLESFTFDKGTKTAAFDGESYTGGAFITRFIREARAFNFTVDFNQVDRTYRTQTGYDPWNDYRNLTFRGYYNIFMESGLFERISPNGFVFHRWNFDGDRRNRQFGGGLNGELRLAQTYFGLNFESGSELWLDVQYDDLWSASMDLGSRLNDQLGFNFRIRHGRGIAYRTGGKGEEWSITAGLNLKPLDRLTIAPNYRFSKSTHVDTDEELYRQYIARTRFGFQATRELSVRLVVQYDDFYRHWDIDPLLTYRLSPFSVFYLGSTFDYSEFSNVNDDRTQWKQSQRQFFMKLQYLFQT
ncbi:MAG: carbohydrate binding family 9 domain-containing protein [candidate division Zixibacteria bacterium]|nr:carbohydrate binding family 9 domain-containing protein [candidate division Zixibacteria bacterium]MDH3937005.1 carbohydrate binding family 9 domain-containing protein [candidate division Zixibacteria bacterium]MDH4034278.1 carbohydrate binding family 9 domain-containing protein [candidate division Zixibacteria bacterium]